MRETVITTTGVLSLLWSAAAFCLWSWEWPWSAAGCLVLSLFLLASQGVWADGWAEEDERPFRGGPHAK